MRILGLSAYYHDSAACLVEDGCIVAAAQEERFTRKKHDASFPSRAVEYCLREGGISVKELDLVGFYEKPLVKFSRLLEGYDGEILFGEHHESHASSAFYPSPFDAAAIVTIDGVGEWATSTIGV